MEPAHNKNIRFVIWFYVFKRLRNLGLLCGSMSVRIELFDIVFCGCLVIASNRLNGVILRYLNQWNQLTLRIFGLLCDSMSVRINGLILRYFNLWDRSQ